MPKLLFYDATDIDRAQLAAAFDKTDHTLEYITEPINENNCSNDAEIISIFVSSSIDDALLAKMPKLKLIACRSTGFNNIDLKAADERNITVVNVPTYGENTVAEYAFMLILALSRKLPATQKAVLDATIQIDLLRGMDLKDKTLGIVGAGHIGQHVASIAHSFGMNVIAYDPFPNDAAAKAGDFAFVDIDALLKNSDVISLHAPYTKQNHHLLSAEKLALIKPTAILINTARGELIDNSALLELVRNQKIGGVGLDVIEGEKLLNINEEILLLRRDQIAADQLQYGMVISVLQKFPNVIITPHNAFNSTEAIERMNNTTAENIQSFLSGNVQNSVEAPPKTMGKLIITRHGESEWNAEGKWTGSRDVHLSEKGFHEAAKLGIAMKDLHFDYAFSSQQIRAFETLESILDSTQQFDVPYERSSAINERDYGDYTGKNKWEMKDLLGEDEFNHLRRDWDYPVPNGETLKMVYERVVLFYKENILPHLANGEDVLIVSHGNAIRALIKYIENVSDESISDVEMIFGQILIYELDPEGHMLNKSERSIDSPAPPA